MDIITYDIILLFVGLIAVKGTEFYIYTIIIVLGTLLLMLIKSLYRDFKKLNNSNKLTKKHLE